MRNKYSITLIGTTILYIIVITKLILDNIYTSELFMFLIHTGTAVSIVLILLSLILSIDANTEPVNTKQEIIVEPKQSNPEPEDEVIEVGILEEFKDDYDQDDEKP